jgi:AcrR family transcriptional regulator
MATDSVVPGTAAESIDPRVKRTREHVLRVTRELLNERQGALTLSLVAERAMVARQTLYTHWGTIENLIADSVVLTRTRTPEEYAGLDVRSRAELFLTELVEVVDEPVAAAVSSMMAALHYDTNAAKAFYTVDQALFAAFLSDVGPVSHDQFVEIVAPVLMRILPRGPVSRQMIISLAERAAQFIPD